MATGAPGAGRHLLGALHAMAACQWLSSVCGSSGLPPNLDSQPTQDPLSRRREHLIPAPDSQEGDCRACPGSRWEGSLTRNVPQENKLTFKRGLRQAFGKVLLIQFPLVSLWPGLCPWARNRSGGGAPCPPLCGGKGKLCGHGRFPGDPPEHLCRSLSLGLHSTVAATADKCVYASKNRESHP